MTHEDLSKLTPAEREMYLQQVKDAQRTMNSLTWETKSNGYTSSFAQQTAGWSFV